MRQLPLLTGFSAFTLSPKVINSFSSDGVLLKAASHIVRAAMARLWVE